MGFKDSFVAVKGCDRATVLEALAADMGDTSAPFPERLHLAELPDGWIVVIGENLDAAFKPRLQALTRLGPAVAASLSESVMYAEARGYEDGRERWRVTWDCELEEDEPETSGELPAAYPALLAAAHKRQAAERDGDDEIDHMFDLPLDLVQSVCGFKFGENLGDGESFYPLVFRKTPGVASGAGVAGKKHGLLQRLFGRG